MNSIMILEKHLIDINIIDNVYGELIFCFHKDLLVVYTYLIYKIYKMVGIYFFIYNYFEVFFMTVIVYSFNSLNVV